jgi:hypothetical protein
MNFQCTFREVRFAPMSVGANQSSDIFFNPWLKPLRKPDSASGSMPHAPRPLSPAN